MPDNHPMIRSHDLALVRVPAIGICLALLSAPAGAQESGPINTERPSFSASPFTLDAGAIQVETGYQYFRDDAGDDFESNTLPQLLVRIGLAEHVELQVAWAGYTWAEAGGIDIDGRNDASIGAKWQLTDGSATVPVALFAGLSLPIGDDEFTSDEVTPTIGAFWSYSGSLDWFGAVVVSESDDEAVLSGAVGLSHSLGGDTGSFVEYFGNYGGANGPEHYLNGGLTWTPRLNLQLDVSIGVGLNSRAADGFAGVGFSYRY